MPRSEPAGSPPHDWGSPAREASRGRAFLFPGQGSQAVGMARALARAFPIAAETLAEADQVLGLPLSRLMAEGPIEELTRTENAQPALLAHGVAAARALEERGIAPQLAAGHSLGEFTALVAARALGFTDALRLVRRRGELMAGAGDARPGTMAAVLGLEDEVIEEICAEAGREGGVVAPANLNAPGQVVISGDREAVGRAGEIARRQGARRVVPLQVAGAFHSALMEPAARGLREALERVTLEDARFPVVANVTAEPVLEAEEIRRLLAEQLTSPVRWHASMTRMVQLGAVEFVECGPGRVLTGLARRVPGVTSAVSAGEPEEILPLAAGRPA